MILRKPYAFLINHFKKIHLGLALVMSYLVYKTYNIYKFFKESSYNNYFAYISYDERNKYTNIFIYLLILLVIISLIAVFYLLHHKNKPRKFYRNSIIFYIIVFIYYLVMSNIFQGLLETTIDAQAIRACQDIALLMCIPQIIVIIVCLITVLGINLKKFNFQADLKELSVNESDNEEVEVSFKFDTYKTKRSFRKTLRELKYYFYENKFILTCIGIVLGVIILYNFVGFVMAKRGNMKPDVAVINNNFRIIYRDSIITNRNGNGDELKDYYIVVKMEITNITDTYVALDYRNYHVYYDKNNLTPDLKASNYFYDFGLPYLGDNVEPQGNRTINLAYKISEDDIDSTFYLKIYKGSTTTDKKFQANYNELKLKPSKQIDIGDASKVSMKTPLSFVNSNAGNTTLNILKYEIKNSYVYTYKDCNNDVCREKTDVITPDYTKFNSKSALLVLDYEFNQDENTTYYRFGKTFSSFVNNFLKVRYKKNDNTYESKVLSRTTEYLAGKEVIQVDKEIMDADSIELVFTIRNRNYIIVLK